MNEYLHDLTESPEDLVRLESFDKEYATFGKSEETKKVNWKLAIAGASAILSAGILVYSICKNFPIYDSNPPAIQESQQIEETHFQPFTQLELPDKINEDVRLK